MKMTINNKNFEPFTKVKEIHTSCMYNKVQNTYMLCVSIQNWCVLCDVYNTCHLFVDGWQKLLHVNIGQGINILKFQSFGVYVHNQIICRGEAGDVLESRI